MWLGVVLGRHSAVNLGVCAALLLGAGLARAGSTDISSSDIYSRARPEYDPAGVRAGSFFLYPSLTSGAGMNGNVFNDSSNAQDMFYSVNTGLKLQSAWSRHELAVAAQTSSVWFSEQITENRTDWDLSARMRLDVMRGTEISVDGHTARAHEARGTDVTGGLEAGDPAEPTAYSRNGFDVELEHAFNRVRLSLGGGIAQFDFDDTPAVQPSFPLTINNDDRDQTTTVAFAKTAIEAWSDTAVFMRGTLSTSDFIAEVDDGGFNRDSSELAVDGGLEFSFTNVLVGEVSAGYAQKSFDDPAFAAAAEVSVNVGLKWFPSMLTTISVDASRSFEDTSVAAAPGFLSTRGGVGLDHELLRNFILSGRVAYETNAYPGIERNDNIMKGSLSGRYLINNNLHLDAGWEFVDRNSSSLPFEYSTGQFQFSLTGKM